ncbi:MAG: peptidoglycan-binding domain-containing protein [Gemmataceae bacterium]
MNLSADVLAVQKLLNKNRPGPLRPIAEDGRIGPDTLGAIEEFQRRVVKMSNPDAKVDPNGATLRALNGGAPGAAPAPPRPPAGAVSVTFRHGGKKPTGVTGLPGAADHTTGTRYESSVTVSGGVSGTFRGSIYPDDMNVKGRLVDGTYDIYLGFHKPGDPKAADLVVRTNGFRAVLVVNANNNVPVASNLATKTTSNGIHIHNGYNTWNASAAMSEGCLILHPADWSEFLTLFLKAYPDLADWVAGGGRLGKKIGTVTVSP